MANGKIIGGFTLVASIGANESQTVDITGYKEVLIIVQSPNSSEDLFYHSSLYPAFLAYDYSLNAYYSKSGDPYVARLDEHGTRFRTINGGKGQLYAR